MNKKILSLIVFSVFSLSILSNNSDFFPVKDQKKISQSFQEKASKTQTILCNFNQIKYISYLSATVESNGVFYFRNDYSVRWEYKEPYQYVVIYHKGEIIIDDTSGNTVFKTKRNKFLDQMVDVMLSSFQGDIFNSPNFHSSLLENNLSYQLSLTSKEPEIADIISGIEMYFDKDTYYVSEIKIHEPSGDYTQILFRDRKYNFPLSDKYFK